jgi:two-component system sensor kinase FixL
MNSLDEERAAMTARENLAEAAGGALVSGRPNLFPHPPAIVRIAGVGSGLVGVVVLLGWAIDSQPLKSIWPGLVSMKANTALGFLFCGISLTAWTLPSRDRTSTMIMRAAAIGTILIGGATLLEYFFHCKFGIDEFIVADNDPMRSRTFAGRPAIVTAANLLLLGVALLLVPSNRTAALWLVPSFGLAASSTAALMLLSYFYGIRSLHGMRYVSSMAVHTAATILVVGTGLLYARPNFAIMSSLRSPAAGGIMARRLMPAGVALPILLGCFVLLGIRFELYDTKIAFALFVVLTIAVFLYMVWSVSRVLNKLDEERRLANAASQETLRQSEERLRLAQQAASIGTFEWNVQTGVSIWTPELEAMCGLAPGEYGKTHEAWEQLVHPDDRVQAVEVIERALATFEPHESEWRVVWPDGSVHWLVGRFQVFKDLDGKPHRVVGINIDITARKAIDESLRESEARARAVLNAAVDAIITIDQLGTIQSANQATERLFGYTEAELVGENVRILMPAPYEDEHDGYLQHYLATGEKRIIGIGREVRARRKDGSIFPADLAVSEVSLVGRRLFTGIVRDLTERKSAEKKLEAHRGELAHVLRLNTMGEMAAGLAHEINQPLSAIHNYACGAIRRLGYGDCERSDLIEVAQLIADESERASTIIKSLKHYVKKGVPDQRLLDINALVRNATRFIAIEAERRSITMTTQCARHMPHINGDAIQLEQVVINLLLNGIEAMEKCTGLRRLLVEVGTVDTDAMVTVSDNGPGLPAGYSDTIFKAFFTTKPHGLGMGLAISRSIIEAHNGRLWAEPNSDGGATFHIALPIHQETVNGDSSNRLHC